MIEEKGFEVYLNILYQTLEKKNEVLDEIISLDRRQEMLIKSDNISVDEFQEIMDDKMPLLEQLEQLDNGFEVSYSRVKDGFITYKNQYQKTIEKMQIYITEISKKVMEIQRLETQNKERMKIKFADMHKRVKNYNVSSKSVGNYYKNMANAFYGEAQFMDKKK